MKIFRSKRPELSGGVLERNSLRSFWANSPFSTRGYWEKKVSDTFGQTAIFVQWVLRERKIVNLSFKTGKTLQWVVERENLRKPSVLALCRGYQLRDRNFLKKSLVKTASHDRWEVRRDFFSEKADHLDGFPPVGIEDGIKPSGKDDYRYVRKAATGIKRTRCLLPLEI